MLHEALLASATPDDALGALERQGFIVDYVEDFYDRDTDSTRRLAAARLGGVRLIDNISVPAQRMPAPSETRERSNER